MLAKCKTCGYRRHIACGETSLACHYSLDTGKIRGCSPEQCDKHISKNAYSKRKKSCKAIKERTFKMDFAIAVFIIIFGNWLIAVLIWYLCDRVIRKAYCLKKGLAYSPRDL